MFPHSSPEGFLHTKQYYVLTEMENSVISCRTAWCMQQTSSSCPIKEYEPALTIQQDTKTKQPYFGQLLQIIKCGEMLTKVNINKSYFLGQCFPTTSWKGLYHLIFEDFVSNALAGDRGRRGIGTQQCCNCHQPFLPSNSQTSAPNWTYNKKAFCSFPSGCRIFGNKGLVSRLDFVMLGIDIVLPCNFTITTTYFTCSAPN